MVPQLQAGQPRVENAMGYRFLRAGAARRIAGKAREAPSDARNARRSRGMASSSLVMGLYVPAITIGSRPLPEVKDMVRQWLGWIVVAACGALLACGGGGDGTTAPETTASAG